MANEPHLAEGQSSEWVLYLQQMLNHAGFPCEESGSFDEYTTDAVKQLQQAYSLPVTGEADETTWGLLTGEANASPGASGSSSSDEPNASHDPSQSGGHGDPGSGNMSHADADHSEQPWADAQTIKVWLKAFIPGDVPGTIDGVGASSGNRLLEGPVGWFNDCFWTDTRSFSSDISASCRMHSEVVINIRDISIESEVHYCGETHEADCEDGDIECSATSDTGGMSFTNLREESGYIAIDLAAAAANPCFNGAPDIDYVGTYWIDVHNKSVSFDGMVNGFPAYESYATVNHGAGSTIFQFGPSGSPGDLQGAASEAVSGTASF
jgi:hypothetical protein